MGGWVDVFPPFFFCLGGGGVKANQKDNHRVDLKKKDTPSSYFVIVQGPGRQFFFSKILGIFHFFQCSVFKCLLFFVIVRKRVPENLWFGNVMFFNFVSIICLFFYLARLFSFFSIWFKPPFHPAADWATRSSAFSGASDCGLRLLFF